MKTRLKQFFIVLLGTAIVAGCDTSISKNNQDPSPGTADFSTFVAIGDSLTAGFADSALYRHGQENSYPAILAQQFARVGGGAFVQPLRGAEFTGSFVGIPAIVARDRLMIVASGNPAVPVTPAPIVPAVPENLTVGPGVLYNNIGVPLAKSFHLPLTTYGNPGGVALGTANPFYVRFSFDPGVTSMIADATLPARVPTFFILWIGSNDILLNAASGTPGTDNPTFGTGATDVTPVATFNAVFPTLVGALKTATNKGMLINIPRIDSVPYFTTVPYNSIPLDAATAAALNVQFAPYNIGVNGALAGNPAEAARRQINFVEGQNAALILDETLTDLSGFGLASMRQATPDDFILLPTSSKLGVEDTPGDPSTTWGVTNPLLDTDVLIDVEADAIEAVRVAYNATIKAQADADPDILFFDAAAMLEELNENGISYGSGGVTSAFIQGGAFSADGIHPTARGYAVIANEILNLINDGFDAFIPPVDPNQYTTVFYQ